MGQAHRSEQLWLTFNDLPYLSDIVGEDATPRKKRLFACACVRRAWERLTEDRLRTLVDVFESAADHDNYDELQAARRAAQAVVADARSRVSKQVWVSSSLPSWFTLDPDDAEAVTQWEVSRHPDVTRAEAVVRFATYKSKHFARSSLLQLAWPIHLSVFGQTSTEDWNNEAVARCELLRDIFGNPFRPVAFEPAWRTSTAVALARQMYESRDFSAMPILADALQDAGCDSADILDHCRDPNGTHVRGCRVVDLVLNKS
jgi:hypothetical protein